MDAFQQPHRFMRPPPPSSTTEPHQYHHAPPHIQQGPWYSGQFQYRPSSQTPSPPPPQWAPPPPHSSDHLPPPPPYPSPLLHNSVPPYPAHLPHSQFPPLPRAHVFPPPNHSHSQIPQPHTQVNQEWSHSNWAHHQGWEYPTHSNEEDWAARARAWATAKAAMDNQHPQSQFTPMSRHDEQSQYHEQYPQAVDPHYPVPALSYQQYPVPPEPPQRPAVALLLEPASIGSELSSYDPDGRLPYTVSDGTMAGESNAGFPRQENFSTSPSVHLQEVPSSYSSVTGKEEPADQNEQLYKSLPFPIPSDQQGEHHLQPSLPPLGRSISMEQPHFAFGNQSAGPTINLADQPLDFVPRFNREHDLHLQVGYTHPSSVDTVRGTDPVAALSSNNWTPAIMSGIAYPSAGQQLDLSMAMPPPISGHSAPIIGRIAGQSLQPPVPSIGAAFGLGAGAALHPTIGFSTDAYGVSTVPERPKKASVPNWLREEIIKKKPAITSSGPDYPKEETDAIEDDSVHKSVVKVDQEDIKSMDSSRSTEEEDDEDFDEAARTAAINQEIKRILTEVLLKVTDELFDEIASKVVNENGLTVEDPGIDTQNHKVSPSAPSLKASAKVLLPVRARESESEDVNEKASSRSAEDILGLANYASDDDDDDEIQSSRMQNSRDNPHLPSGLKKLPDNNAVENGSLQAEIEDHDRAQTNGETDPSRVGPLGGKSNSCAKVDALCDTRVTRESEDCNVGLSYSLKGSSEVGKHEISVEGRKVLDGPKYIAGEKVAMEPILQEEDFHAKKLMVDDSEGKEAKIRFEKNERHEISGFARKDKQLESGKKLNEKRDENRRREDDRHLRKEKTDERNGSKHRLKGQDLNHDEKAKETDLRKRSLDLDAKEGRKEIERVKKSDDIEETNRKHERAKDGKGNRSRHKPVNDLIRDKRRHSSSLSSRGRNSKENSVVCHANDSSEDASEDSKRKLHSRRRNLSPSSPSRSKRRQVSRSPHNKRSQRRHSPYSSLEITRGRRSRSRSPARWRK